MTVEIPRRSLLLGGLGAGALSLLNAPNAEALTTYFYLPAINQSRDRVMHAGKLTTDKSVWLTFDDYGSATQVNSILATLYKYNVRAVFFPQGDFARYHPSLIRAMRNQGHIIGNHSYNHPNFFNLSNTSIRWQVNTAASYIRAASGLNSSPKLFRCPYGNGAFSDRINPILTALGYQNCYWTVDTRDWSGISAAAIVRRVRYGDTGTYPTSPVYARGVVLMHMHGRYTGAALPGVIGAVRARGLVLPRLR